MGNILITQKRKEKEFDFSALYICDDMFQDYEKTKIPAAQNIFLRYFLFILR